MGKLLGALMVLIGIHLGIYLFTGGELFNSAIIDALFQLEGW